MKKLLHLVLGAAVVFAMACGSEDSPTDVTENDSTGDVTGDNGAIDNGSGDNSAVDVNGDTNVDPDSVDPDAVNPDGQDLDGQDLDSTDDAEVEMVDRYFTFRTIGGISMGAAALTVASHYPEMFDNVGALGGYVDYRYVGHLIRDFMGGGFCPMDQILQVAADDLANGTDELNNMDNPLLDCTLDPAQANLRPYEVYMTYNKMAFAEQGGTTFDRSFFIDVLGALVYGFGNFLFYNPEHPLLPPGVDMAWLEQSDSQKCANPAHVAFPHNVNKEFNPKGEYDLITFCDGDPDVCRGVPDCDEDEPATRVKKGWYFPDQVDRHNKPVAAFLAVDYNGNGMRDYGEPVVFNLGERWSDVGVDGCTNEYENGQGGCSQTAINSPTADANGDDWQLIENPAGTEGNSEYDDGEPYDDFGIDGVEYTTLDVPDGMTAEDLKDLGEGDGKFTYNPRWENVIMRDGRTFFRTAPIEELNKHSYFFDGGIHDGLGALTAAYHLAKALELRGVEVKYYKNFVGQEDSVFNADQTCDTIVLGQKENFGTTDLSTKSFGKNFLIAYGDPSLSDEEAYVNGTGNHVGNGCEVTMRATVPYAASNFRMPDAIVGMTDESMGDMQFSSYYSETLKSRRWFSITLPPDYNSTKCWSNCDAENAEDKVLVNELEYPVSYLLPGIGMPLDATSTLTYLFNATMMFGTSPRYVVVVPDGQCCFRTKDTNEQVCNCFRNGGNMTCVDAQCKGKHSECTVTDIPRGQFNENHEQECNSGHFFVNQATNRFGATGTETETMKFENALIENILYIQDQYRIRKPGTFKVPADF